MKKLFLFVFGFFLSYTVAFAETLTTQILNISQTSADITISATDIKQRGSFGVLSIRITGLSAGPITFSPVRMSCVANTCNFPTQTRNIPNLTCNTNYRGSVEIVNSLNDISKPIEFKTLPCETGIKITFDSIKVTSAENGKALVKLRIQDSSRPVTGLDVKAVFKPIAEDSASPSIIDSISFSRDIGLVSNATNERTIEKEIDIGCTQGVTPKKYIVAIEATSRTTPPKVSRSEVIEFITDICPEAPSVGNGDTDTIGPTNNTYTFLTPLPLGEGLEEQDSVIIGSGGILGILQRIFTIMLVAAVVLAVVFMIIGGARYATGDTLGGKMGGRQIITNAITGLLFALLAWLLLNIVNPDLLRFTLSIPNIGMKLTKGTASDEAGSSGGGGGGAAPSEGCGVGTSKEDCMRQILADEDRVRTIFRNANISINKSPCQTHTSRNCTNVGKLSQKVIDSLLQIKRECNCAMMITGGTEYLPHAEGGVHSQFIAVDMQIGTEPFDSFIKSKGTSQGSSGVCRSRYNYAGLLFCDETIQGNAPHWHVYAVARSGNSGSSPQQTGCGAKQNVTNYVFDQLNIAGGVRKGTVYCPEDITRKLSTTSNIKSVLKTVAQQEGIDYKLFRSLISQESEGDFDAGPSPKGAYGIGQMLISTAREYDTNFQRKFTGKDDAFVISWLKSSDPEKYTYSLRLSARYLKSFSGNQINDQIASYNGGPGALGTSANCPGRKKWECPWESGTAAGGDLCYDPNNPKVPKKTNCQLNADRAGGGYEETRFYVTNIKLMMSQVTD